MIWFKNAWTATLIVMWLLLIFSKTSLGLMIGYVTMPPITLIAGINVVKIIEHFKNKFK